MIDALNFERSAVSIFYLPFHVSNVQMFNGFYELNSRDYSMFVDFNAKSTLRSSTITPYIYQEQRTECSDHNSQVCMYVSVDLFHEDA